MCIFFSVNADLNLRIGDGGCKCNPITVEGFAFMWAGARSNYGVNKGKVAFEMKVRVKSSSLHSFRAKDDLLVCKLLLCLIGFQILEHLNVDHLPPEETSRHVVRVGFSTDATTLQLGKLSNCYLLKHYEKVFQPLH